MWDIVITTLFVGKDVADFDAAILDGLEPEEGTEKAVKAERMTIAVRNENGDIYRAFGITGLGSFMQIIGKCQSLGLVDELQHQSGTRHGYDAIFGLAKR